MIVGFGLTCIGQVDTLNQTDDQDRKQGYWIYYGSDRPSEGYPLEGKVEEGPYLDNRKAGLWIKYHIDGKTPKLVGEYANNRPSGEYRKYYQNGNLKEQGTFTKNRYGGELLRYFESGRLQYRSTDHNGVGNDSLLYYFESGCLEYVIVNDSQGREKLSLSYYRDSCNVVKDRSENVIHAVIDPDIEYLKSDDTLTIVNPNVNSRGYYRHFTLSESVVDSLASSKGKIEEFQWIEDSLQRVKTHKVHCKGTTIKRSGYLKLYNKDDEIYLDGEFQERVFWNGKQYEYDKDGILLHVRVFKKGLYHSDGQL
ncbi:MAG: hypothetical protein ACI837_000641 [Crocinitomicaceae bacterium]|jgi:hypothetical protein